MSADDDDNVSVGQLTWTDGTIFGSTVSGRSDMTSSSASSSSSTFDVFRVVLNVYVVGVVCAFGITGNLISMAVLGRDRSIRRTTGFLLQALAASDTAYLVACLLYQTTKTVNDVTDWGVPGSRFVWPYLEPYVWPLASIAQTCTVWTVVVVTADRYIAICRPLHAAQYR
jgi:7 transmembrane receptor (rhodopsin family)